MSNSTAKKTIVYRASVRVRIYEQLNRYSWYWSEHTAYRDFTYDPRECPRFLEAWSEELLNMEKPNIDKILTSPEVEELEVNTLPPNRLYVVSVGDHVNHISL